MQGKINPLIAVAAIGGVLLVLLVIFLIVRNHSSAGAASVSPASSTAYTHPGPGNHP